TPAAILSKSFRIVQPAAKSAEMRYIIGFDSRRGARRTRICRKTLPTNQTFAIRSWTIRARHAVLHAKGSSGSFFFYLLCLRLWASGPCTSLDHQHLDHQHKDKRRAEEVGVVGPAGMRTARCRWPWLRQCSKTFRFTSKDWATFRLTTRLRSTAVLTAN